MRLILIWVTLLLAASPPASAQAPQPELRIAGAVAGKGIRLSLNTGELQQSFRVESMNPAAVDELRVFIAPLLDAQATQAARTWIVNGGDADSPVLVPGLGHATIELRASLPAAGEYTSTITLIYGGRRHETPLTVVRPRASLPVKISGLAAVRGTTWPLRGGGTDLWFTVRETAGEPLRLAVPMVSALALKGNGGTPFQTQHKLAVLDENGKPVTAPLLLTGHETRRLRLLVSGLAHAGEYNGTLQLVADDGVSAEEPITLVMKDPWLLAALLILLGVLGSYGLRAYFKTRRPQLLWQRRLQQGRRLLDGLPAAEWQARAIAALQRDLAAQLAAIELGPETDPEPALAALEQRLALCEEWAAARRRIDEMRPAALRDQFRSALDRAEQAVCSRVLTTDEASGERRALSRTLERLDETVRSDFRVRIGQFQQELQHEPAEPTARELVGEARKLAAQAGRLLDEDQMQAALSAYDQARLAAARAWARDLAAVLAGPPPRGFTPQGWDELRKPLQERLARLAGPSSAEAASTEYQAAQSLYLAGAARALQSEIKLRRVATDRANTLTDDKKDAAHRVLDDLAARLSAASEMNLLAREYPVVSAAYDQVVASYPLPLQQGDGPVPAAPSAPDVPPALSPPGSATPASPRTPAEITATIRRGDWLATGIIIVIAVLSGMKLLWIDDPTWGGANAYLVALLWGLTLHQASGVAFEGITDLRERLAR